MQGYIQLLLDWKRERIEVPKEHGMQLVCTLANSTDGPGPGPAVRAGSLGPKMHPNHEVWRPPLMHHWLTQHVSKGGQEAQWTNSLQPGKRQQDPSQLCPVSYLKKKKSQSDRGFSKPSAKRGVQPHRPRTSWQKTWMHSTASWGGQHMPQPP